MEVGDEKDEGRRRTVGRLIERGQYRYGVDGDLRILSMINGRESRGGSDISADRFV